MSAEQYEVVSLPTQPKASLNVYQRINEVRKKVWYVQKDKAVSTGGSGSYKATTHDAVTALVRNHLIEQGVLIVPKLTSSCVVAIGETKGGTPVIRYEAKYDVEFANCDNPGDKITVPMEAHANDSGDKAPGKAVSYATKYAILKLFNIETGENEESRHEPYESIKRITEEQSANIEALITEVSADKAKFLKWMQADSVEGIQARDYDEAVKALETKRGK